MRRLVTSLFLCSMTVAACKRDVDPVQWDALDLEEMRDRMDEPTAAATQQNVNEVAEQFIRDREALEAVFQFIEDAFETGDGGAGDGPAYIRPRLEGTNVFVKFSCLGDDLAAPVLDFSQGHLRLDSPSLSEEFAETFFVEGAFLLGFSECRLGRFEYAGDSPGHYVVEDLTLAIDFDWAWTNHDEETEGVFDYEVLWDIGQRFQLLTQLGSGETMVVEWSLLEVDFAIRGSDGEFACTIDPNSLEPICVAT